MEKRLIAEWETGAEFVYRVREGDELNRLAERFGTTALLLIRDNRLTREPREGEVLLVRRRDGRHIRVTPADTLSSLSRKYGVPPSAILERNAAPYLFVGLELIL